MTARPLQTILTTLAAAALLASCGGGGDDPSAGAAAGDKKPSAQQQKLPPGTPVNADAHIRGQFGPVQPWPVIPVHAVLTADGRVLSYGTRETGQQTAFFQYSVWDSVDSSHLTWSNGTGTDIFCSSQILLPSGDQVFIAGGDNWTGTGTTNTGNNNSNLYASNGNTLTRQGNMNRARWYSSSTMLLSGEVYVQGGSGGTDRPEVRAADGSFRLLSGANTGSLDFMYPRNFVAPDGRIFGFDSAGRMYYVNANGTGTMTSVGQFPSATAGSDASAAMFAPGRILQFGGNSNGAIVIDITGGGTPSVTNTAAMAMQRRLGTATLMADGKVLATGGSSTWNEMINVVYDAEIWNPTTGQWARAATAVRARLYHSVGLLLPDATVLVAGGGAPGPQNNLNAEIYHPPYLFTSGGTEALRPVITTAPTVVDPGKTVNVAYTHESGRPVRRVTFAKTGSVTHSWNMDQRFVDLPFTAGANGSLSVQIPARASDVPPGMWMMFVFDDAGVPSVAKMVRVNVAPALNTAVAPTITTPASQGSSAGNTIAGLQISASDPNGDALTYSASGLPPGLSIDPATGRISGTPATVGSYTVTVAVSDGFNSASTSFGWTVTGTGPTLTMGTASVPAPSVSGSTATFGASAAGTNVRYSWNFGDGSAPTAWSTSGSATRTYAAPGIYFVTVTATDDTGAQVSQTLMHQVFVAATATAPRISGQMAYETRSGGAAPRLWVVNPDNNSVSVFDTVARTRIAEINVGTAPRALAIAPDGSVWVSNRTSGTISVISASTLAVTRSISVPRGGQPYGIAFASSGALVALEGSGQLLKINPSTYATTGTLNVGANARHVSVAADGSTALVSRFISPPLAGEATASVNTASGGGLVVVVNAGSMSTVRTITLAHSNKPDAENQGRGIPNYLGAATISPDGTQAWVPSKMDNIARGTQRDGLALNFQSTVRAISSRIVMSSQSEDLAARIDHDNASVASAAAYDPLGVYLFVALETSREIAVLDAHRRNQLMRIDVGFAPQGVLVSPDRKTLYVHNFMDRTIGIFDLTPLTQQARADAPTLATISTIGSERLAANVVRGKKLFYDARDPRLARDRYMSCATCHNDGGHDGRVWDLRAQGEGLRNTIALKGRASMGHGALHWSNNFNEMQDFEGQIRTLAGGSGLMSDALYFAGTRSQPLGDAKAGQSADLDDMAAYVASLDSFDLSPSRPSASTLSTAANEGRTVFINSGCASCHAGTAFTRSAGGGAPADIGTLKTTSGTRLNGTLAGIDVPTLRDVWTTAPYLHDGSAATIDAAIAAHAGHGLATADITRLAAYVRELGSDEGAAPTKAASGAGLLGSYYAGVDLAGTPIVQRIEAVNYDWTTNRPAIGVPVDNFSVRWTGTLTVPTTGNYTFQTYSDDGVRLWVNGTQLVNNWTDHSPTTNTSASIRLTAGQRVSITLEYYERGGGATMQLRWKRPSTSSYVAIPASSLNTQ